LIFLYLGRAGHDLPFFGGLLCGFLAKQYTQSLAVKVLPHRSIISHCHVKVVTIINIIR
jgi:hypothetical protein